MQEQALNGKFQGGNVILDQVIDKGEDGLDSILDHAHIIWTCFLVKNYNSFCLI